MAPIRFGLFVPQGRRDAGTLREIAQTAERSGFHSLWVYDHLYNYPSPAHPEVLEAFTLMSLLAGWTQQHPHRRDGAVRRLPQPGADGEDGRDARRASAAAVSSSATAPAGTKRSTAATGTSFRRPQRASR